MEKNDRIRRGTIYEEYEVLTFFFDEFTSSSAWIWGSRMNIRVEQPRHGRGMDERDSCCGVSWK